jgi:hypothetical protein
MICMVHSHTSTLNIGIGLYCTSKIKNLKIIFSYYIKKMLTDSTTKLCFQLESCDCGNITPKSLLHFYLVLLLL